MDRRCAPAPLARRLFALGVLVAVLIGGVGRAADAHTQVRSTTPSAGAAVGRGVDEVRVEFLDPVLEGVQIGVTRDGRSVAGLGDVVVEEPDTVRVGFDPLEPGTYEVRIAFVAVDGDAQVDAFQFDVTGAGDAPGVGRGALGAGIVALGAVAVVAGVARRRRVAR